MSGFKNIKLDPTSSSIDAGSRLRVSQLVTHGDLKKLNSDKSLLWESAGTGTGTFSANTISMSANSGQYFIRASKRYFPYYAGKSQMIECTFDSFHAQENITKRVGYFSSNAVAPYNSSFDGFFLENDGTTVKLRVVKNGTDNLSLAWTSWDNYANISTYDWSKFTVAMFDFLWLGGTALRLFLNINGEFVLAHTFKWAGTNGSTMIQSPNQKIRYEIRSTTGIGTLTEICSQVSTEGQPNLNENAQYRMVDNGNTIVPFATIGTKYPVKALRLKTTHRDISAQITNALTYISTASDVIKITFELNPILSSGLTYADISNSALQEASGNTGFSVLTSGTIIEGFYVGTGISPVPNFETNMLAYFGSTLNNTMDEIIMCATPITANPSLLVSLHWKEF